MTAEKNKNMSAIIVAVAVIAMIVIVAVSAALNSPRGPAPEYPVSGYGAVEFTDADVYAVGLSDYNIRVWLAGSTSRVTYANELEAVSPGSIVAINLGWIIAHGTPSAIAEIESLTKTGSAVIVLSDTFSKYASAVGICYNPQTGEKYLYTAETFEPKDALIRSYNWSEAILSALKNTSGDRDFGYYSDVPLGPTVHVYGDKEGHYGWLSVYSEYSEILYGRDDGSSQYFINHSITVTPKSSDFRASGSEVRSTYDGNGEFKGHLFDMGPGTVPIPYHGEEIQCHSHSSFREELFVMEFTVDRSSKLAEEGFTADSYAEIYLNGGTYSGYTGYYAVFANAYKHSDTEKIEFEIFTDVGAFAPRLLTESG
ncbi:MAG: hypothetical protein LBJ20_07360 [Candidatus Methanoplasma sp.]|jgi:hypothetical protein|nr:hypothetical protein [Candidatus Methanoplasma sp.]